MKRLFALLAAIVFALVAYAPTSAQPCLVLAAPNSYNPDTGTGVSNPDSVMIDTCCTDPNEYEFCKFANRYWAVHLEDNMYPFDHVLLGNESRRPSEMRPLVQALKDTLIALENQFGPIYLIGLPYTTSQDTSFLMGTPHLKLYFERYQNIHDIKPFFRFLPFIKVFSYIDRFIKPTGFADKPSTSNLILPNPSQNFIRLDYIQSGEEYKIYNSYGSLLLSGSLSADKTINVERLSPGVYLIVTKSVTERFVKE